MRDVGVILDEAIEYFKMGFEFWPSQKKSIVQRLLLAWVAALLIALVLWSQRDFAPNLIDQCVYSFAISTSIWLLTDVGGLLLFFRNGEMCWPSVSKRLLFSTVAIVVGYALGTLVGDAYSGYSTFSLVSHDLNRFIRIFLVSIAIGLGFTGYFYQKQRIATAQRQVAQAHLKLLESQLEPHMLFNTLANLRALIQTDTGKAIHMLDALNNYLRATLSGSLAKSHTLGEEFARLQDYLALMGVRMGTRLSVSFDCPAALSKHPIPPLLLQPLVENAIKHGLEPAVLGGTLHVQAQHVGEQLHLTVSNTGVGALTAQSLEAGTGYGLSHVRERLSSTYGDQAIIRSVQTPGYTCSVQISVPWSAAP